MKQTNRTLRLFVSSTFSDLIAEPFDSAPAFVRPPAGEQGMPFDFA